MRNGAELKEAARSAKPGDVITLADGLFADQTQKVTLEGTKEQPITIRAKNRGGAVFSGRSSLEVIGKHVVLEGLTFQNGHLKGGHVIRVRGEHCRVTRCSILNYNPPKPKIRYHWLSLHGHHHRVDHCRFEGQNHSGCTLVVWLDDDVVGHHRIDRNHFGPRLPGEGNGFETLRIGDSQTSMKVAKCLVVQNLFESCDGEVEIVSNKSCENTYLGNTFEKCEGALTLRHGNRCVVQSNLILGGGKKGTGGIRVVGEDHIVSHNHVEGTDGRVDGAIALSTGVPDGKLSDHAEATNVDIFENTLLNNRGKFFCLDHGLGSRGRTLLPVNVSIHDNHFYDLPEEEVGLLANGNVDHKQLGLQLDFSDWDDFHPLKRSAHRLTAFDVGPDSVIEAHPDAIANSHEAGKVDDEAKVPYIIPNPRSIPGIVIDETEAELVGNWQYSTHTPPYVGVGYLHDQKKGKGEKSVTYRFTVPKSGVYHVEMSHCWNVRRATNTPVTIHHAAGEELIRLNQQRFDEERQPFRSLGQFRFEAGSPAWIRISNEGTEGKYVIADAVRLIFQE